MFGFRGGESVDTVVRKKGYLRDAQQRWPGVTTYDLSTITNETQLLGIVKDRLGRPEAQVRSDVQNWMQGKQF
jgi:hypothetical protein